MRIWDPVADMKIIVTSDGRAVLGDNPEIVKWSPDERECVEIDEVEVTVTGSVRDPVSEHSTFCDESMVVSLHDPLVNWNVIAVKAQ